MTEEEIFIERFKRIPDGAGKRRIITTLNFFLDTVEDFISSASSAKTPRRNEPPSFNQVEEAAVNAERSDVAPSPVVLKRGPLPVVAPFPDKARADFRLRFVRKIWAPGLRSELVERVIAMKEARFVVAHEITAAVAKAKKQKELYDSTNGAQGVADVWISITSWCKGVYATNGYEWTPCSPNLEPAPPLEERPEIREATPEEVNAYYERQAEAARNDPDRETVKKMIQEHPCYRRHFSDDARRETTTERETENALAFEL